MPEFTPLKFNIAGEVCVSDEAVNSSEVDAVCIEILVMHTRNRIGEKANEVWRRGKARGGVGGVQCRGGVYSLSCMAVVVRP